MNSPDPGSPISTDTSGSPSPDDFQFSNRDQQQNVGAPDSRSNISYSLPSTSGPSKRRLPGGSSSEGPQRRDPKSRRREDVFGSTSGARRLVAIEGQTSHVVGGRALGGNTLQSRADYTTRRDKEELIDLSLVEQLRQDFGDPFLDVLKQLS